MLLGQSCLIFPVAKNGKEPLIANNLERATADPRTIEHWKKEYPDCNWGIACGRSGLYVIDVDMKNGKNGAEEFRKLTERIPLPETMTVRTPTGGLHYIFRGQGPSTRSKLAPGIDTRGMGGYIVAPGSAIDGKTYEVVGWADVADVPEEWLELHREATTDPRTAAAPVIDTPSQLEEGRRLARTWEPSVEGEGGHENLVKLVMRLGDLGLSPESTLEQLQLYWNHRCDPVWTEAELRTQVYSCYKSRQNGVGCDSLEASGLTKMAPISAPTDAPGLFRRIADLLRDPESTRKPDKIPSGYEALDTSLDGGFVCGGLTVVAARTSNGKSTLLRSIALRRASEGVAYLSMEDSSCETLIKLCAGCGLDGNVPEGRELIIGNDPDLWIAGDCTSVERLVAEIEALPSSIRLVIVDQLSWLHSETVRNGDAYRDISACVQALKLLAKRRKLAVVVAAQINRSGAAASRDGGELGLHHLRDSGRTEETADAVFIIQGMDSGNGRMAIDLLKNRQGRRDVRFHLRNNFRFGLVEDDCCREVVAIEDASGQNFEKAVEAFLADEKNLRKWDSLTELRAAVREYGATKRELEGLSAVLVSRGWREVSQGRRAVGMEPTFLVEKKYENDFLEL